MAQAETAPYGSWRSPLTAAAVATSGISLSQIVVAGGAVYWVEGRPREQGRQVIVRRAADGSIADVTPPAYNARTRVHEYGGGAYDVHGSTVFFTHWDDQRLYRQEVGGEPRPITPQPAQPAGLRYADLRVAPDGALIVCVHERHYEDREAVNELVVVPADGSAPPRAITSGHDFYAFPRISPDGRRLAWTSWDHPRMPWDGSELWVADLASDGTLSNHRQVAGGPRESVVQPEWSPEGVLHFVSDRTGWWNLYRLHEGAVEALAPMEAEFGEPQWVFGNSSYAFLAGGRIACAYVRGGMEHLGVITSHPFAPPTPGVVPLDAPYSAISSLQSDGHLLWFIGASPTQAPSVISMEPRAGAGEAVRASRAQLLEPDAISTPRAIEFPTEGGLTAHALFYAPLNPAYAAPAGEKPPLLVMVHGGPTGSTAAALSLSLQYWTSRGFAVVAVNYGGSSGYGRAYRERLNGQWGVVDMADCINAARYLAAQGLVDGRRLAIRGGSAGGYTTLCAVVFSDVFAAGASHFGIADMETFVATTHKFESRYVDGLIGPYPAAREAYRARSPIHAAARLACPLILFQGLEDKVVPPSQAEQMVDALRERHLPFAYVPFEGEQHGFRRAANIQRALEAELYFYGRVFGFPPADPIEPLTIENLA